MHDLAIRAEGLSKAYYIAESRRGGRGTFGERLVRAATGPLRRAANLLRGRASGASELTDVFWALRDVSFEIRQGEVLGLIGRNGAGKSTLLKLLSRISEPTSGHALVRGRLGSLLEVGTGFHPELSGRENIFLNGAILGMRRVEIQRRFDEIVAFAEVEKFLETPVKHYSSGMYLRLAFAVAAHLEPDVLLVDEVLAVGDAEFQRKCLNKMQDVRQTGRTVVFVSHNMAAIENLCSRSLWLDGGRIREDGPTHAVIQHYLESQSTPQSGGAIRLDTPHRIGTGEVRFTHLEILEPEGRATKPVIRSGERVLLRLWYRAEKPVSEPHFGIDFFTGFGTAVTTLSTWATGLSIPRLDAGEGYADLTIEGLNLMPGRYHLSLWCEGVNHARYDILDRCCAIDVEQSDFYGSGRGISQEFGITFFPCSWKLGRR